MSVNNLEIFRAKIAHGGVGKGLVVTLADPAVSELAGDAGFDFTWIDAEHGPHTLQTLQGHVMAHRGTACAPFVRVAWNEWGVIKPVLDLAPAGIIVPMVNTAEEAARAVASCRYPPAGNRGYGARRGTRYGAIPMADYLAEAAGNPLVIIQIEHVDAVRNLDAILAVPGIDSICLGPMDLSGSLGMLGRTDAPEVMALLDEVSAKVKRKGLLLGTASGAPYAQWKKRGVDWIAPAGDCDALAAFGRDILTRLGE